MEGAAGTEQSVGLGDGGPRRDRVRLLLAVVLLLAATFLRLYHLDESSLWLDEITTERYSRESPGELFRTLVERDNRPPLPFW